MIYFVHGPDRLLAAEAANDIATQFDADGNATSRFDGKEIPVERIIEAIGSASFFGGSRVVVVTDLVGKGAREDSLDDGAEGPENARSKSAARLGSLLAAVPDGNCLIIVEPSLSSPPATLKSAAATVTVVANEPPRGAALLTWIIDTATRAGSTADRSVAQLLAETLYPQTWDRKPSNPRYDRPPDLAHLTTEIEKLVLFAHPGAVLADHVRTIVSGEADQHLFRFVDATLAGDLRRALAELDSLIDGGEEPAMLLAQVLGQAEIAAPASFAGGRDSAAVARDLSTVTPGRVSSVMASLRGRRASKLPATIELGVQADRRMKTGRVRRPEGALQELVVDLALDAGT